MCQFFHCSHIVFSLHTSLHSVFISHSAFFILTFVNWTFACLTFPPRLFNSSLHFSFSSDLRQFNLCQFKLWQFILFERIFFISFNLHILTTNHLDSDPLEFYNFHPISLAVEYDKIILFFKRDFCSDSRVFYTPIEIPDKREKG